MLTGDVLGGGEKPALPPIRLGLLLTKGGNNDDSSGNGSGRSYIDRKLGGLLWGTQLVRNGLGLGGKEKERTC